MKAYAEIQDYGRRVGIVLTRPSATVPDAVNIACMPGDDKFLFSIAERVAWGTVNHFAENPFAGNESTILPIGEVQLIFDALWRAGMRPTHE